MGNSHSGRGPRLLENGKCFSYQIKLDNAATIAVTKDQERSHLKYDVDGMTCKLSIGINRNSDDEYLSLTVKDIYDKKQHYSTFYRDIDRPATIDVKVSKEKKESGVRTSISSFFDYKLNPTKRGRSVRAGVETEYRAYGSGNRMGLLVAVKKKKSNEEGAYMVTVAHYYVNSGRGGNVGGSGGDIGFSVVVKIGVMWHNGQLDYSVDGPVEHPSSALLYMIEDVIRTQTWKLSSCPHCKNIQWQRRWLSESEDSDTPLPPPRHGGQQNAANMGQFNGDGNGSIIQANKINFNKWSK